MICDFVDCKKEACTYIVEGVGLTDKKPDNEDLVVACWCKKHTKEAILICKGV